MNNLIVILVVVIAIICVLLFILGGVITSTQESVNSNEAFECGFEASGSSHLPFNIHFYLVGILFVIFDVELVVCLPLFKITGFLSWFLGWLVILSILIVGYLLEVVIGSLDWND